MRRRRGLHRPRYSKKRIGDKDPLLIGQRTDDLRAAALFDQTERDTHMHVLGSTGTGKSRFLESLIQQDIQNGIGLCLLDPHGSLFDHIVKWISNNERLAKKRKLRIIDLKDTSTAFGFNPLAYDDPEDIPGIIDAVITGITLIYGGNDPNATPLIKATIKEICSVLLEQKLTLVEAEFLLNYEAKDVRNRLTQSLEQPHMQRRWTDINARKRSEFAEQMDSTERRIRSFLENPTVRAIFGQNENTIDFKKAMDDGEIILINCAPKGGAFTPDMQQLIGMLVINNLIARAKEREADNSRPFHLYIDEAYKFINNDIASILAETRKFGLHLTLAHQNLGQLFAAGDQIYAGVMGEAKTKIVFGGISMEDATAMAKETLYGEVSPDKVKKILDKPVVVDHELTTTRNMNISVSDSVNDSKSESITKGKSDSRATSFSNSTSAGSSTGSSTGQGEAFGESSGLSELFFEEGDEAIQFVESSSASEIASSFSGEFSGNTFSQTTGSAEAYGRSESRSQGTTVGKGKSFTKGMSVGVSETYVPVLKWLPTATYTLEEQYHELAKQLKDQPTQFFTIRTPKGSVYRLKALNVPDETKSAKRLQRITSELRDSTPYLQPREQIEEVIHLRHKQLLLPPVDDLEEEDFLS